MKLYKKQIRPYAYGCAWQGFSADFKPLSDWIDVTGEDKAIESELREKWDSDSMYLVTKDRMMTLEFQYRFVEYTGIVLDEFVGKANGV